MSRSLAVVSPVRSEQASPEQLVGLFVAFTRLLVPAYLAREQDRSPADAPVAIAELTDELVGVETLTWMLYQGYVDHFQPAPSPDGAGWCVRPSAVVDQQSAFAI